MDQKKTVRPFSMKDKIGYTLGDLGCCFTEQYRAMYLSIFYTLILQVNPFHVGILLLVTKIWDAVNDHIIGAIVESRTATKGGKFIPWIRAFSFPMAVLCVLGFVNVGKLNSGLRMAYMFIPYVMIDRMYPDLNCSKVYFDNESGAYMAIEKLVKSGHKKIACIGISSASKTGASRVAGYRKAMQQFQLEVREDYILDGNYRFQGGYTCAKQLMKMDVTAAFICNDMMTLGVMRYFQAHHVRIPQDISIVSYDNTLNRFTLGTEITSVDQNV